MTAVDFTLPNISFAGCPPIVTGPDAYRVLPDVIQAHGARSVLLLGGRRALAAGLPELKAALSGKDISLMIREFSGECTMLQARAYAGEAVGMGAGLILGMGGGKALDTAKAAAHLTGLPVITLPTIPATCAALTALSVLHDPPGSAEGPFLFLDHPPAYVCLHTGILSRSPAMYLRAGIGDSLAKAVESAYKAGAVNDLSYTDRLGLSIAQFGFETLLSHGASALADMAQGKDSPAFRLAAQLCIVNTGLVSLLVQERLNGALAHALYYALRDMPGFAEVLHGDAVAWGSVVLLALEGNMAEAARLKTFLGEVGSLSSLREIGLAPDDIKSWLPQALAQPDMAQPPTPLTLEMVLRAALFAEAL